MDQEQEKILTYNGKRYKKRDAEFIGLCDGCCFSTPYDGFGNECRKPTSKEFAGCGKKYIFVEVKS